MEGENGTPQITPNGNHAGRKREAPGVPQPIQEVSYLSQGRTRERMAIGVIPLTRNGPSHLIYGVRGWTARQRRLHRDCVSEARGSGKSLEALGMKPEPTDIRGKMTRPRQVQEVMTGQEDHWRSQRKLEQVKNQGRWAQCGATRVSSVPVEARSFARIRGMTATGWNA